MPRIETLKQALKEEQPEGMLWLPVWLALGIGGYFSLASEPGTIFLCALAAFTLFLFLTAWRLKLRLLFILCWVGCGFLIAANRAHAVAAPVWRGDTRPVWIHGTVEAIEPQVKGQRLILSKVDLWKIPTEETPAKVRLRAYHLPPEVVPGSRVAIKASLRAPPRAAYPGGYDFARVAYFDQVGATGYGVTPPRCLAGCSDIPGWQSRIERVRERVHQRILTASRGYRDPGSPAIASALLTGLQGAIPKADLTALRLSGLGHLLSISGLHMVMVAMTIFFVARHGLALFPAVALRYDTKKWAASLALMATAAYLLLAGSPVPAQRSFIMLSFFFLALLLDRPGTPLRPLAWAAVLVLVWTPEALLTPSFQMSFGAVLGLIASFDAVKTQRLLPPLRGIPGRFLSYVMAMVFSSLVAGFSTMPFAIYHFGRPAFFGVLSNLLAIPLSTFLIMPAGLLALFLMPVHGDVIPLSLMCIGIDGMVGIAKHVAALPYGDIVLPKPGMAAMLLITFGVLMLALMRTRLRLLGLVLVPLGLVAYGLSAPAPDLIVDGGGKLFAIRSSTGAYYFSSLSAAKFARREWANALGIEHPMKLTDKRLLPEALLPWHCGPDGCTRTVPGEPPLSLWRKEAPCPAEGLTFLLGPAASCREGGKGIGPEELAGGGTYLVTARGPKLTIQTSTGLQGKRLWTGAPNPPKK